MEEAVIPDGLVKRALASLRGMPPIVFKVGPHSAIPAVTYWSEAARQLDRGTILETALREHIHRVLGNISAPKSTGLIGDVGDWQPDSPHRLEEREFIRAEILQSRVSELSTSSARLVHELDQERARANKLDAELKESWKAANAAYRQVISHATGKVVLFEEYEGVVVDDLEDSIVVQYESKTEVFEHSYSRSQFAMGRTPKKGERLAVRAFISVMSPKDPPVSNVDVGRLSRVPHTVLDTDSL